MNDWLIFNTSKGKDLQGLVEGGASFGTSIQGWGQYNEDTNLTVSETRKLWMTVRSTLKRVVLGEMGHAWVQDNADRIELFYLPPYAPEHNPDEFLNNDLKQAMARRRTPRDKAALKSGLTSYRRSLQRCPAKVRAFFQAPTVRYAA